MSLSHAVLALLADGPDHGYELKLRFESAIGPQWGGLNIGHLYQILDRLVRDGCITGRRIAQPGRPDKTEYRLTEKGGTELRSWATTGWVRTSGFRDTLFLKLFGASRLGPDALSTLIGEQRRIFLTDLAELTRSRREHDGDPLVALLIDAAISHTKADLEVLASAEQRRGELSAALPTRAERRSGDHRDGHNSDAPTVPSTLEATA